MTALCASWFRRGCAQQWPQVLGDLHLCHVGVKDVWLLCSHAAPQHVRDWDWAKGRHQGSVLAHGLLFETCGLQVEGRPRPEGSVMLYIHAMYTSEVCGIMFAGKDMVLAWLS